MKIALVCKDYSLERGGLERYSVNLGGSLARQGHDVHVFAHTCQQHPEIQFHRVPLWRPSSPLKNLSFAYFSRKLLQKEAFDVIQSMERVWYQDIFRASDGINPVQLKERFANPVVRRLKSMGPRRRVLQALEDHIFRKGGSRRILTNSHLIKRQIMDYYQVTPEKITVIYNSVDARKFSAVSSADAAADVREKFGVGPDTLLLLFVGNDFRRKGLDLLLTALQKAQPLDFKLLVIGKDKKEAFTRAASPEKVLFLGPQRQIEWYYHGCDLFVLPTRYDAFANVCLEAMACGRPVITSNANGASEVISHGRDGFVIDDADTDQLAHWISECTQARLRGKIGDRARSTALKFTRQRYMSQLLDLYRKVQKEKITDERLKKSH